jgi:hypothetical protein
VVNNTEINSSYLNHCFLFCVNFMGFFHIHNWFRIFFLLSYG